MRIIQHKIIPTADQTSRILQVFDTSFEDITRSYYYHSGSSKGNLVARTKLEGHLCSYLHTMIDIGAISLQTLLAHSFEAFFFDHAQLEDLWDAFLNIQAPIDDSAIRTTTYADDLAHIPSRVETISLVGRYIANRYFRVRDGQAPQLHIAEIGSGAARFSCYMAALFPLQKITCLEMYPARLAMAKNNFETLTRKQNREMVLEFIEGDAANVVIPDVDLFFLYKPFRKSTLNAWLNNVAREVAAHPRPITIIYVQSDAVDPNVRYFMQTTWLDAGERIPGTDIWIWKNRWPVPGTGYSKYSSATSI